MKEIAHAIELLSVFNTLNWNLTRHNFRGFKTRKILRELETTARAKYPMTKLSTKQTQRHVALLVESSRSYIREMLMGIAHYVRLHRSWSVEFQEGISIESLPGWFASRKWNGIIAEVNNAAIGREIKKCGVPVVDVNGVLPNLGFPVVRSDDILIGRMAADHLIERGFRQFAFCGFTGTDWSDLRRAGFERRVAESGFPFQAFENPHPSQEPAGSGGDWNVKRSKENLKTWLRSLPKPLGMMACNDSRGWRVLACCRDLNLRVPDELAVIGVDNDEIFCELSTIPLSSVIINARQIGYEAAALLDQLMADNIISKRVPLLKPVTVAERRSTDALAVEDPRLKTATNLIREHACEGLDVTAVLKAVRMSRKAFERQFVTIFGRTPKAEILRVRLKRVSQLLAESNWKLAKVASEAGFQNPEHMCRLFKKKFGITPGQFRNQTARFGKGSPS